ncbi:unnamed protein product [Aureobasidium uvarum]|uniref:Orc1-like AAA ATPase domain-containing protein n=1 Tax=Aureobasidium uvarum TaxID=2773716 RepID=A0A9N8PWP6_9PEZI|nr:unnamed protein product [Aureobasidium uvarum]
MSSLRPLILQRLTMKTTPLHLRPRPRSVPQTPLPSRARAFTSIPGIPTPEEEDDGGKGKKPEDEESRWKPIFWKSLESTFTTLASLAAMSKSEDGHREHWILREEQTKLDAIVRGELKGQYYLIVGEKGTGKSSMLIDAMAKIEGEGVAMFDAHSDLEIFRVRLGKALDFEYHEDNIGSLFSIRGPRDASALLDIERAFNKLEKVALRRRATVGRPLIMIINNMHLLRDDEDGRDLLELLQQRAEQWAASNLATIIFNSDDYWVYERLKQLATRMVVMPVPDLPRDKAMMALSNYRARYHSKQPLDSEILEQVYQKVGGRLAFLNRVAKSHDMLQTCEDICRAEKTWLLSQTWILGEEMDDDVMDQQKYAVTAMVLAKALVDKEKEDNLEYDLEKGHMLPQIPLHKARQIMTRADFIQSYDAINIFTIDSRAMSIELQGRQNYERTFELHQGVTDGFSLLLQRTSSTDSEEATLRKGASSLLSMCLRRVPDYIRAEEDWRKSIDEDDDTDVSAEVYEELEDLGSIQGRGWSGLREVVIAHGVSLVHEIIRDKLVATETRAELARIPAKYGLHKMSEDLLLAYAQSLPLKRPLGVDSRLFNGCISSLTVIQPANAKNETFVRLLDALFSSGRLKISWLATRDMASLSSGMIRALASQSGNLGYILHFLQGRISQISRAELVQKDVKEQGPEGNLDVWLRLEKSLSNTTVSIITVLTAIVLIERNTHDPNDISERCTAAESLLARLSIIWAVESSLLSAKTFATQRSRHFLDDVEAAMAQHKPLSDQTTAIASHSIDAHVAEQGLRWEEGLCEWIVASPLRIRKARNVPAMATRSRSNSSSDQDNDLDDSGYLSEVKETPTLQRKVVNISTMLASPDVLGFDSEMPYYPGIDFEAHRATIMSQGASPARQSPKSLAPQSRAPDAVQTVAIPLKTSGEITEKTLEIVERPAKRRKGQATMEQKTKVASTVLETAKQPSRFAEQDCIQEERFESFESEIDELAMSCSKPRQKVPIARKAVPPKSLSRTSLPSKRASDQVVDISDDELGF